MCWAPCLTPNSSLMDIVPVLGKWRWRLKDEKHFPPNHPFPEQALGDTKMKKRTPASKSFPAYLVTVAGPDRTRSLSPGPPSSLAIPLNMDSGPTSTPPIPGHPVRTGSPRGTRPVWPEKAKFHALAGRDQFTATVFRKPNQTRERLCALLCQAQL